MLEQRAVLEEVPMQAGKAANTRHQPRAHTESMSAAVTPAPREATGAALWMSANSPVAGGDAGGGSGTQAYSGDNRKGDAADCAANELQGRRLARASKCVAD